MVQELVQQQEKLSPLQRGNQGFTPLLIPAHLDKGDCPLNSGFSRVFRKGSPLIPCLNSSQLERNDL